MLLDATASREAPGFEFFLPYRTLTNEGRKLIEKGSLFLVFFRFSRDFPVNNGHEKMSLGLETFGALQAIEAIIGVS